MTQSSDDGDRLRTALAETVLDDLGDGLLVVDGQLDILLANRWVERRYSGAGPLAGKKCYEALFGRKQACPACPSLRTLATGKPNTQATKVAAGDGRYLWMDLRSQALRSGSGEIIGVVEQIRDVTKLRMAEDRLSEEAALRHIFVDDSRDGVAVVDPGGRVIETNQQLALMLGVSASDLVGSFVWNWDPSWTRERVEAMLQRAEIMSDVFEMRFQRKGDPPVFVEVASNAVTSGEERLIYWICRDITDKKTLQEELRELGIRDPVTGLYDRRYVLERLTEAAAEYKRGGSEFCISIIDLDGFKKVNEVHGPKAADLALERFATIIEKTVRPYDVVGRFGGDEFIIVSKNAGQIETEAMIRRIHGNIRGKDLAFEGHMMRLDFSCGLASCGEFPGDSYSIDAMIGRAYDYLRRAKATGGDKCVSGLSPEAAEASVTPA